MSHGRLGEMLVQRRIGGCPSMLWGSSLDPEGPVAESAADVLLAYLDGREVPSFKGH